MDEIVERALESVEALSPDAKVRVERHYAPDLPPISADAQLCERIFVNLIQNAYQAMDSAGNAQENVLRLMIKPEISNGRKGIGVTVADSGPGVPPELREQIFNPFVTSKTNGVGLGLALVAKFVDDHRGSIQLENNSEPGARFHVFLPAAAGDTDTMAVSQPGVRSRK